MALVERSQPPAGATRVAAGMLAPVGELTFGEPEPAEDDPRRAELYPEFVAELEEATGVATGYRRDGALHVALDRDEAEPSCAECTSCSARSGSPPSGCRPAVAASWSPA